MNENNICQKKRKFSQSNLINNEPFNKKNKQKILLEKENEEIVQEQEKEKEKEKEEVLLISDITTRNNYKKFMEKLYKLNDINNNGIFSEPAEIIKNELYLSDYGYNSEFLYNKNIKTIVNLSGCEYKLENNLRQGVFFDEDELLDKGIDINDMCKKINVYHFVIEDDEDEDILSVFDNVNEIFEKKENQPVLCHCLAGVSRSASCVITYCMKKMNICLLDSIRYVKKRRRVIYPNWGFFQQMITFSKRLEASNK